jgi:cell division protein FtsQ
MLNDTVRINQIAFWVGIVSIVAIAWSVFTWANGRGAFALGQIAVTNKLVEVDPGLLESMIRTDLRGTFFTVAPHRVRATLKKLPWVRDVVVERRWPMALDLRVEEFRAVGYWGDNEMISDSGEVFRAVSRAPMPRFEGPTGTAPEVLSRYREAKLALAPLGLSIKALSLSSRGAISFQTTNDLSIDLGKDNFDQRLNRFVTLYTGWSSEQRASIARVDLRYKSAVAIARGAMSDAARAATSALAGSNANLQTVSTQGNAL